MNIKTLSLALLAAVSAGAAAVTIVDLDDVSKKAEELSAGLFTPSITSQPAPVINAAVEPPKPQTREVLATTSTQTVQTQRTFGSFPAPTVFPNVQPTLFAGAFSWSVLRERARPRKLPVSIPYWVSHKRQIVMPTARIDGALHDSVNLELQPDGTFKQLYTSFPSNRTDISAANYRAGTLVLTSLMVGDIRFSNVKMVLRPNGNFEIVEAYLPIAVEDTSTENHKELPFGTQILPVVEGLFVKEVQQTPTYAFADFTQTGQYAYFADIIEWFGSTNPQEKSTMYFYNNVRDSWVNITSSLMSSARPRGCESSRKAVTADFNGDEMPDVFVACWGSEHQSVYNDSNNDQSFIIMSRPDGSYTTTTAGIPRGRYHAAVAFDFNNTGFADLYVSNFQDRTSRLQRLRNNRNGTFTMEHISHPTSNTNIWTMEIVKHAAKNFIVLAGSDTVLDPNTGLNASMFEISRDGSVSNTATAIVPTLHPTMQGTCGETCFSVNIDVLVHNNSLYVLKTNTQYTNYAIAAFDLQTRQTRYVHMHNGFKYQQYAPGVPMPTCRGFHGSAWFEFMRVHDNKLIADAACVSPNVKLN